MPGRTRSRLLVLPVLFLAATFAHADDLAKASQSYKQRGDYASLRVITRHLAKGMSMREVEGLLGKADYSPTEGQYYYGSDRSEYVKEAEREIGITLVLEFRSGGTLTGRLESWWLGPVGE